MKLEGSLDAFSLPDVFQLLSLTKKSGGLHLTNGQAQGVVFFADGIVTGAISDLARQSLARRLVGLGAVDDAALRRAVERCTAEGAGVTRSLLEAGAVDPGLVQRLALEQAVDAVFDLLRWPNGDFAFAIGEENPDEVGLSVPAEQVVGDAAARRDAWEALSRLIPSPDVVLTMPVVVPEAASIAPDEWALLSLIDGQRSVGVLVDVSGAGQYTVVSTLATLVQRGLLVLRDEESPDHASVVWRRQQLLTPLEGGSATVEADNATAAPEQAPQQPIVPGAAVPPTAGGPMPPQTVQGAPVGAAAPAANQPPVTPAAPAPQAPEAPAAAAAHAGDPGVLPGAHAPAGVVPPRPEPFMPKRAVDHPEPAGRAPGFSAPGTTAPAAPAAGTQTGGVASTGTAGVATAAAPAGEAAIERDPTVNRSLMLRLIAGVRGL
ncbi:MAG TPA: DUF4388 domain-containing protein [Actinomycetes bacterium]|nr:DUF4388 domain-containing protein [Actinomycetes bacterium]